jgi:hypothetical protein
MVAQIKQTLLAAGPLSLRELAGRLQMTPDALEPLLQLLVRKGRVQIEPLSCGTSCDGCSCAAREDMLVFTWRGGRDGG